MVYAQRGISASTPLLAMLLQRPAAGKEQGKEEEEEEEEDAVLPRPFAYRRPPLHAA